MSSREECLFDPLSGGLFDDDENAPALFGGVSTTNATQKKSTSLFDDDEEDVPDVPAAPTSVAASSTLFDDNDTSAPTAATSANTEDHSDVLSQVDLSKISVVQKIDRSSKKKKNAVKAKAAAAAAQSNKNSGLLGADDDELDLTLRLKIEEDTLDAFLLHGEGDKDTKKESASGLFDSDDSDIDDDNDKGTESSGAYVKRMLTEDQPDDFDIDIADLSVAKMLTTESDTAGGLIEVGDSAKNVHDAATLANRTSDELLNVVDDGDLEELMAATQVSGNVADSAPDGVEDLFSMDKTDDVIDDDLFNMVGMGGGNARASDDSGTVTQGDMSSIDAYISAQSGSGGGLFD